MIKDNLGNTLTKEQIDYFGDSKVVDSSGNLLVCYHGTRNPGFTEFDARKGDSFFGEYKFKDYNINYFTTNKKVAQGYTEIGIEEDGNIYSCYVNIVNPFIVDNDSVSEIKSWNNVRDLRIRDKQIVSFNAFWSKWSDKAQRQHLEQLNKELFRFGFKLVPNEEDDSSMYYDLVKLADNSLYGNEHPVMYQYEIPELFDSDMYEEVRDNIVGNIDDPDEKYDYYLTIDEIVKWVIAMNEEDGQNFDGIIVEDISDVGPRGSFIDGNTTDVVTIISGNQIKSIDNKNPTSSNNINEKLHRIPDYLVRDIKTNWGENGKLRSLIGVYDIVTVPVKKLVDDNNLLDDNSVKGRREHIWGSDPKQYHYDKYKDDITNYPIRIVKSNDKYRILDGNHRVLALYNDGYDQAEVLMKRVDESLNEAKEDKNNFIRYLRPYFGYNDDIGIDDPTEWEKNIFNSSNHMATQKALNKTNEFIKLKYRIQSPMNDFYWWMKNKQPQEFIDWLEKVKLYPSKSQERRNRKTGADEVFTAFDGTRCYKLNNYEAAEQYGKGTKWCISGNYAGHEDKGRELFNDYSKSNDIFLLITPKNEKYSLLVDVKQKDINGIWDAQDKELYGVDILIKVPAILDFINDYILKEYPQVGDQNSIITVANNLLDDLDTYNIPIEKVLEISKRLEEIGQHSDPWGYEEDPNSLSYVIDRVVNDPDDIITDLGNVAVEYDEHDPEFAHYCRETIELINKITPNKKA